MKVDLIRDMRSHINFGCPNCGDKMRTAYISLPLLCCLKCNIAWELHWRKSPQTIKQIKEDGWLTMRDVGLI